MIFRVGVQGEPAAYSYVAAQRALGTQLVELRSFATFEEAHDALHQRELHAIFVPIENTLGGTVHANYDCVLRNARSVVLGEFQMRIDHCLMARPGTSLEDVKTVISHPQALAQCASFIRGLGAKPMPWYDTAGAAKSLAADEAPAGSAAIASRAAAEHYKLEILSSAVQDLSCNATRFLLVRELPDDSWQHSEPRHLPGAELRTSLVFAADSDHQAGALSKCLQVFALRDVNVLKVESRPLPAEFVERTFLEDGQKPTFRVIFFLDVEGALSDARIAQAVNHLRELSPFVRIIGSYPAYRSECPSSGPVLLPLLEGSADEHSPDTRAGSSNPASPRSAGKLRVGLIGFGTFGQFLAKRFVFRGLRVFATSRSDYSKMAAHMGVEFRPGVDADWLLSHDINVMIVACSIKSFGTVIEKIPFSKLGNCIVMDVLSVKSFPKKELLAQECKDFGILCTHPFFGPHSGAGAWKDLPFIYDCVRLANAEQSANAAKVVQFFSSEGCRAIDMSCEAHDAAAAGTQFLTHLTGRLLARQECHAGPIDTLGYKSLLSVMENTCKDSWDLFKGLYEYNEQAENQLVIYEQALADIAEQLRGRKPTSLAVRRTKPSATSAMLSRALQMRSDGVDVKILSVGQPHYMPPECVRNAIKMAADQPKYYAYGPLQGDAGLRDLIAKRYNKKAGVNLYTADNVVLTTSLKLGIFQMLLATVGPGCDVLVPTPCWVSYGSQVALVGARPVEVPADLAGGRHFVTADQLREQITEKTRLIMLCSPSNPSGVVIPPAEAAKIVDLLLEPQFSHVSLFVDEIYDDLVMDSDEPSFFDATRLKDRCIIGNGFSKSLALCGLRIGYLLVTDPILRAGLLTVISQTVSCVPSLAVAAAKGGMEAADNIASWQCEKRGELRENLQIVLDELKKSGLPFIAPQGAFYVIVDVSSVVTAKKLASASELARALVEQAHVAVVSTEDFGLANYLRVSYATDKETIVEGMRRLVSFLGTAC